MRRAERKKIVKKNRKWVRRFLKKANAIGSGCTLCDQWIAAGYYPGITKRAMHQAHGFNCPKFKADLNAKPPPHPRIEIPDVGRLQGFIRYPEKMKRILAATPTREYPPLVNPLRSFRPHDILMWAETWRDLYEQRNEFLTIGALHNLILHSELKFADQEDAHVTLTALYREESGREVAEAQHVLRQIEEKHRLEAEAEKLRIEMVAKQLRISTRWGVPVDYGSRNNRIYGHPLAGMIRWMAADAFTFPECRKVVRRLGFDEITEAYVRIHYKAGRYGGEEIPFLQTFQADKLNEIANWKPKSKKGRK